MPASLRRETLAGPAFSDCGISVRVQPLMDLLLGLILRNAVSLLYSADELVVPPIDHTQVIIRQFSPTFLGRALDLFPLSLQLL